MRSKAPAMGLTATLDKRQEMRDRQWEVKETQIPDDSLAEALEKALDTIFLRAFNRAPLQLESELGCV